MTWVATRRAACAAATVLLLALALWPAAKAEAQASHKEIIFVGSNWDGTVDVIELTRQAAGGGAGGSAPGTAAGGSPYGSPNAAKAAKKCRKRAKRKRGRKARAKAKRKCKKKNRKGSGRSAVTHAAGDQVQLKRLGRLNIVPDMNQRIAEIATNPVRLAFFLFIQQAVGEGNNQYVDDMYTSNDGELLIVSRPSFADVVAIRIATGEIVWRSPVAGQRADHMAISPDGRHVAVSAQAPANVVQILDVETGQEVGRFPSGDTPHENTYSEDGRRIYHASIGHVYTPLDNPALDATKGARNFQVVNAEDNSIIKRINVGQKLAEAGHPNMSSAVRPMAITHDESRVYMQVSFFHGFVEYDNVNDQVLRVANLPDLYGGPRESYLLDSAHHGIAINGANDRLCVAGTMSDYAAIVSRSDFNDYTVLKEGTKPYWSTTSDNGEYCYVSWSGTDSISVIDYESRTEVGEIGVGNHPQRIRTGHLSPTARAALKDNPPPVQPPPPLGPLPITLGGLGAY